MDTNILQSFGIMLLAVAILAAILFMLKQFSKKRGEKNSNFNLNVISKISLQPKNHLFVVKVAEKVLVLGVSDNNINILTELELNFCEEIKDKSDEKIKNTLLSKLSNKDNNISETSNNDPELDLSFMKFIKSSLNFK